MSETNEAREKAIQANEIAGIVIDVLEPEIFAALDLRYGIADALWAAGYRRSDIMLAEIGRLQQEARTSREALTIHRNGGTQ